MSRIPLLAPEDLDEDQRRVYQAITTGPRAGGPALSDERGALVGPFNLMVTAPVVGARLQALGSAVRYSESLSARVRELAILRVAAHHRSDFEWVTHEREARSAGVTDAELDAVVRSDPGAFTDPVEGAVLMATCAILDRGDLTDAEFAEASAWLGVVGVIELTTLIGYYSLLALQLRVLRVPADGRSPWTGERGAE